MATLIAHKGAQSAGGNAITTAAADTTNATLIVLTTNDAFSSITPTDSKSNTWTGLTVISFFSSLIYARIWYCLNPTTDGSHTFTAGANGSYSSINMQAWDTYNAYDSVESGTGDLGGPDAFQNGSVTPSGNNSLLISLLGQLSAPTGTPSIDLSFTVSDYTSANGNSEVSAMAYLELGTAAAKNPTWNRTSSGSSAVLNAVFKTDAGGGGGSAFPDHYYRMMRH